MASVAQGAAAWAAAVKPEEFSVQWCANCSNAPLALIPSQLRSTSPPPGVELLWQAGKQASGVDLADRAIELAVRQSCDLYADPHDVIAGLVGRGSRPCLRPI